MADVRATTIRMTFKRPQFDCSFEEVLGELYGTNLRTGWGRMMNGDSAARGAPSARVEDPSLQPSGRLGAEKSGRLAAE